MEKSRLIRLILPIGVLGLAFAIVVATIGPPSLRPHIANDWHSAPLTYFERFSAWFLLAGSTALLFPRRSLLICLAMLLSAAGLEWAQTFVPGRHARGYDVLEKVAGGLCAILVIRVYAWVRRGRRKGG